MTETTHTSFPRLNRGTGAQWMTREDAEQLARSSNLQLANSEGVTLTRSPSGPMLDIYGLTTITVRTIPKWSLIWRIDGITEGKTIYIPPAVSDGTYTVFLYYTRGPTSSFWNLYSNAPGTLSSFGGSSRYIPITTFPTRELPTPLVLPLGSAKVTAGTLEYTPSCTIAEIYAWLACRAYCWSFYDAGQIQWTQSLTGGVGFDLNRACFTDGTVNDYTVTSSGAFDGYLRWNPAAAALQLGATGIPLARVQINAAGYMYRFNHVLPITLPAPVSATNTLQDNLGNNRSFKYGILQG